LLLLPLPLLLPEEVSLVELLLVVLELLLPLLLPFQIRATSSSPATAASPFCTSGLRSSAITCCCRLPF
jgi:hypothetical protein